MIKIVDGYLAHQRNKIGKVRNAKFCLPNHIPVRDADWFKRHFRQLYFKTDWSEIHFLSKLSFPFYVSVFTSAENMSLLPVWLTRAKKRSAAKSDENITVEGVRNIKADEKKKKDPSATVVASIRSTGATVVGSVNATEFWQRRTRSPSFLLLLSRKMDLAIPQ